MMNKLFYIISFILISFSAISQQFSQEHIVFVSELNNYPNFAHAVDITGDNTAEVLSSNENTFWYNDNDEGFFTYENSVQGSSGRANSGDFDNDGNIDLILWQGGSVDGGLFIYFNDGDGGFVSIAIDSPIGIYRSLTVDDLNLDGMLDIIVAVPSHNSIFWMKNEGGGIFADAEQIVDGLEQVKTFSPVDVDGDGDKDIVTSELFGDMFWFENDGDENFSQMEFVTDNPVVSGVWSLCADDFDGDGDIDVAANTIYDELVWFSNNGDGTFSELIYICDFEYCSVGVIKCGDIDNDGDIDLINSRGEWYENDGDGDFTNVSYYTETYFVQTTMELTDMDNDGDLDVLSAIQSPFYAVIWFENLLGEGCIDNTACNYNESAFIDNGSCCYGVCGCIDSNASNYMSAASCDNGSCQYEIDGFVFYDENEDGIFNNDDIALANQLIIDSDGIGYLTNNEGHFFTFVDQGSHSFTLESNLLFPFFTTDNPQTVVFGLNPETNSNTLNFGISSEMQDFNLEASIDFFYPEYSCDALGHYYACFYNSGNVPIEGQIVFEIDELFQGYEEVSNIDSIVGNTLYSHYDNLFPEQFYCFEILLYSPAAEYIGEVMTIAVNVNGIYNNDEVATGEFVLSQELLCSYDPNDKRVFPEGISEEHYVVQETELDYVVRFQNTGNTVATDVLIIDTIDDNLDLNSFSLVSYSHLVDVSINFENRVVEFLFENVMLPDSTENEEESHGYLRYKIALLNSLEHEDEVNNTAYIFFDNNPPIITNTTWTTIYDCEFFLPELNHDVNQLSASEGELFEWFYEGELIEGAINQNYLALQVGNYAVQVTNALGCTAMSNELYVDNVSVANYSENQSIRLFPNPMNDVSVLYLPDNKKYNVKLYSLLGEVLHDFGLFNSDHVIINRKKIPSGIYFIEIVDVLSNEINRIQLIVE